MRNPEVAIFAIYLLSEQSEQKIYMSYMATKGVAFISQKNILHMNF